ncbi:dynamin family protein [Litoreibacter roseus]|uniref:Dynamin N-terminal domain-containing protein n=1 Tax=Litoreibacter roseus TaxID=2601869 RepID=A0A6N6JF82_9RHOB|nr:dynamin family protein [Litoreibacter roseus]GFE64450.1 hypothetical protein KIN_15240 [Litoreibacter roseus]
MTIERKPRIALMGEFSAGKSTLSNLLLGSRPLPEKVTATQLPPVWISYGDEPAHRVDLSGEIHAVDLERLEDVPLEETTMVRIFDDSDILTVCDLIDMPGISDPNMSSEVWQRVVHHADAVLWCTHATQAWRQSEAAVWETMPESLKQKSILLITRIDKIHSEKDRLRIIRRVASETRDQFCGLYPISLTEAMAAGEDREKWVASGGDAFADALIDLTQRLTREVVDNDGALPEVASRPDPVVDTLIATAAAEPGEAPMPIDKVSAAADEAPATVVLPRRVRTQTNGATARPARDAAGAPAEAKRQVAEHKPVELSSLRSALAGDKKASA